MKFKVKVGQRLKRTKESSCFFTKGKLQPNFFDSMIASLLALFITKSISLEKRLKRLLKLSKKQNTVIKEQTDIIKMLSNRMGESPPSDYIN